MLRYKIWALHWGSWQLVGTSLLPDDAEAAAERWVSSYVTYNGSIVFSKNLDLQALKQEKN